VEAEGQRPRWRIQGEKTHLISTSMSCKGAKDYQTQDIGTCPLAFLVALGRLDLSSKENAARKVVSAVVPVVLYVDPGVKSVPETADHLRGKSENADGFRARIEPEGAGSFGTRAELAETGGFGAEKEPNKAGQTVLGPELSQRREVISWPGSSRRRQSVLQRGQIRESRCFRGQDQEGQRMQTLLWPRQDQREQSRRDRDHRCPCQRGQDQRGRQDQRGQERRQQDRRDRG